MNNLSERNYLLQVLEGEFQNIDLDIPKDSAVIMDGMAVQSLHIACLPATFGQLTKYIQLTVAPKGEELQYI